MDSFGIYLHIPYCKSKCRYCDFYSAPGARGVPQAYVDALLRELNKRDRRPDTLYFGGGTPALLSPGQVQALVEAAAPLPGAEITLEANPDTVTPETLRGFRAAGVTRISFGVQSADDAQLRRLGRTHTAAAAASMEGALYRKIQSVQDMLLSLQSHLAAYTDYPEEEVPELEPEVMQESISKAQSVLQTLIDGYDVGAVLRRGVPAAIVGSPNVGKSTLMNLLSGFERAIVTPVAGTTRDVVEQDLCLAGVQLHLADTAGIRQTGDIVEAEGIRRSYAHLERAALVLAVFDASREITEEDIRLAEQCRGKAAIAILNKNDLEKRFDESRIADCFAEIISISAKDTSFLFHVEQCVGRVLGTAHADPDALLLANERQLAAAVKARDALQEAQNTLSIGLTLDAAGVCVEDALDALYELTGERAAEHVIDEVFARFCVGK